MNDLRQRARHLIEQDTISLNRLWVRYWTHDGTGTVFDLDVYLYDLQKPTPLQLQSLSPALEDLENS
ncbi:hypothetical protein [Arthrobacter sp. ISL-95]|uniref:hypothetical protein n=1 Tax=Arthrobacter sp. ISL-95 TaxID=2819116 RepID=UPI001BE6148C|nr:hypothetical protein [Arthrobacter sp. ISL-95]MBT2586546.1 hypothetical protein [Arthrobacter sp. ISL-95]